MIIIAVAVLLLAWGVYSLTNSGQEEAVVTQPAANTAAPAAPAAPASASAAPASAAPSSAPASATPAPASGSPAAPAAPADGAQPKVFALNNSTVQGLANRVADDLKKKGFQDVESGNFPHEILPKSVAFYTQGNANEEQAARQIAQQLGIVAEPRIDALKELPAGVVVVITEDLNR